jgi:DNA polymerase
MISVDHETYSEFNISDGTYGYASHPSTRIMCTVFIADNGWHHSWTPGMQFPDSLRQYVESGGMLSAYNANFERLVWNLVGVRLYGWPPTTIQQWTCSAAQAACLAGPRRLDHVAKFFGHSEVKDKDGQRVMMRLCKPNKAGDRPHPRPGELTKLINYCHQDVVTERAVSKSLRPMQPMERPVWELDQTVNDRGFYVDTELAQAVQDVWEKYSEQLNSECVQLTKWAGAPEGINATQVQMLLDWVNQWDGGKYARSSLTKDIVEDLLRLPLPDVLRRVLEIRLQVGSSAVRKFSKFLSATGFDSRLRGSLAYHGASTGRFAGRLIQPQNLARGILSKSEIAEAIALVKARDLPALESRWPGKLAQVLGSLARPTIQAPQGSKLVICDLAQIEARVLAWLAGQLDLLGQFASGQDPYSAMAAKVFGGSASQYGKGTDERQLGKASVLGAGFQMGWSRFRDAAAKSPYNVQIDEPTARRIIEVYRGSNRSIVNFWYALDRAAVNTVQTGQPSQVGRIWFWMSGPDWLHLRLPSGRDLSYYKPTIKQGKFDNPQVEFRGVDGDSGQPVNERMYGGKWTENCCTGDTQVLTPDGWKRIDQLEDSDLVHDGVTFVEHAGLVHQGRQAVGRLDGVGLTPDHKVLTHAQTWKAASQFQGFDWQGVRSPNGHQVRRFSPGEDSRADTMRLRNRKNISVIGINPQARAGDTFVWMRCKAESVRSKSNPRHVPAPSVPRLEVDAGPVLAAHPPSMGELRRAWYTGLQAMAGIRSVLGRYGAELQSWLNPGTYRRQRKLRTQELLLGNVPPAEPESPRRDWVRRSDSGCRVGSQSKPDLLSTETGMGRTADPQTLPVYDIRNCGPRHRFLVRGDTGPFVIHNCVQAVARDVIISGMFNAEAAGYPVVFTVHDEVIAEVPEHFGSAQEMEQLMCKLPHWADGLPVEAEGFESQFYCK